MAKNDRAFANDVQRFDKNIYQTEKGAIREAVLCADLQFLLQPDSAASCLDVGAGLGQINTHFAQAGYQVLHTDIAEAMVTAAKERHTQAGLAAQYQYATTDLQSLAQVTAMQQYDVVLCHAVLEWLAEPYLAIAALVDRVKPGGWLSLMFYNRDAKRMANILYGNFAYVNAGLKVKKKVRFSPNSPLQPTQLLARLGQYPLQLVAHSGVRCFHDYMRSKTYAPEQLLALELEYRRQSPYRELGRYQHLLLRKDKL